MLADVITPSGLRAGGALDAKRWLRAQDELSRSLHSKKITPLTWQKEVEQLAKQLDVESLLAQIDFPSLRKHFEFDPHVAARRALRLPHPDDPKREISVGGALFGMRRGAAITPHGHRNMVSAHLVVEGSLHVRNFDRVADEEEHLIIRPTLDGTISPGDCSTMSTEHNNVHWFTAQSETAFTFDIVVDGLDAEGPSFFIDLIDPSHAERLRDGTLRARRIEWDESVKLYGKRDAQEGGHRPDYSPSR